MVCLRNICINTLHKGDGDDDDDYNKKKKKKKQPACLAQKLCLRLITDDVFGAFKILLISHEVTFFMTHKTSNTDKTQFVSLQPIPTSA
jgi:hypothetical protein